MRPLEVILAIILAVRCLEPALYPRRRRLAAVLEGAALTALVLHLVSEGFRWQMIPLYLLTLALVSWGLAVPNGSPQRRWPVGKTLGGLLLVALAVLLPVLLPVPRLPAPTGPYAVGTLTLDLTDLSRSDPYAPDPASPRRLMVQVWYPAEPDTDSAQAPWAEHMEFIGPALGEFFNLPGFLFSQVRLARTHAFVDAPVVESAAPMPLILFSHGWNGVRFQNTYQMEELASHGYVVAAVEHTYGAMTTVFSDGSVAGHNPAGLPFDLPEDEYRVASNRLVTQWAQDLAFVLDTLASLGAGDAGGLLAGRLDLARVGVMGHSTGGGAAVEFCAIDARCQAGLTMDAYLTPVAPAVIEQGALPQPFLWMRSQAWLVSGNKELADTIYENMPGPATAFTIQGTAHFDFTDLPMFTPLAPAIGLKGPLAGSRVLRIVNDYTLAFFGQALLGQPSPLLAGPSADYPEVVFIERGSTPIP